MITPQHVVNIVLQEAAKLGRADETMVLVTEKVEATLRWAGNSMTTNGVTVSRSTTVISIVRKGDSASIGTVVSAEVDPRVIPGLVAASQDAARAAPEAGDAAPLLADTGAPADWDAPVAGTGAEVFADVAASLSRGFRGTDRLYGFAHHSVSTTFLASSTGLRRRFTQPTGAVEINGKRGDASAWAGIGTADFVDVPTDLMLEDLSMRLGWAERTRRAARGAVRDDHAAVGGGGHDDLSGMVDGRPRCAGRPHRALGARRRDPGRGAAHRLAVDAVLRSDGARAGMHAVRRGEQFLGDGVGVRQRHGDQPGRLDPRRRRSTRWRTRGPPLPKFDANVAVAADNLVMTGGTAELADMIAGTERGLLLTTLWYIREVDPTTLLLTGLTRDGVYLIEDGEVTAAVNNFRFNESPLDLLRRATEAGASEKTLPGSGATGPPGRRCRRCGYRISTCRR